MRTQRIATAGIAGLLFGLGLQVAQMTDPAKVLNFLDLAGSWDASLLFVLAAAVIVSTIGFQLALRSKRPLLDERFHWPPAGVVDRPLILGSALFGVGWGLAGYCPGPAIAALAFGRSDAAWLVGAMLVGACVQRRGSLN